MTPFMPQDVLVTATGRDQEQCDVVVPAVPEKGAFAVIELGPARYHMVLGRSVQLLSLSGGVLVSFPGVHTCWVGIMLK